MWINTYSKLTAILYADQVREDDLKLAVAISEIAALRRSSKVSEKVGADFIDAIESAVKARMNGQMPPIELKKKIRRLFLDA